MSVDVHLGFLTRSTAMTIALRTSLLLKLFEPAFPYLVRN
jgi:hypothetical protein